MAVVADWSVPKPVMGHYVSFHTLCPCFPLYGSVPTFWLKPRRGTGALMAGARMTTLQAFLLGMAAAWSPAVLVLAWVFVRRPRNSLKIYHPLRARDGERTVRSRGEPKE